MQRSRSHALLACLGTAFLAAGCDCEKTRSATFTGHLGDSTVAVGIMTTAPGGMDVSLGQFDGKRYDDNTVHVRVNFSTFADSVSIIRLADFNDPARTPIVSFGKNIGAWVGTTGFELTGLVEDLPTFQMLWDVFAKGDGLVEVVPHQGAPVRARIKPLAVGGWGNYCT
jgi:hypothetical protein